ncbi:MAG TPA: sugar ABC transporter substrate-binding protein [Pseudonocardia sp.]|jgi:multiple sugar transport system substrate-binding protein|uniref:ABC transporter substrate-binding protein n=1 Tax=Pseudonocardia sp. TaxID=60912 RepID=UPI002B4AD46D|nr:sugar ABC transporter substrate-binding protein [Pseudonocardia sp.]HLU57958.1 sugar ABC transporter substrate-binding protein [Pseudonocardia sp.]
MSAQKTSISRRTLLRGAGLAAAGTALSACIPGPGTGGGGSSGGSQKLRLRYWAWVDDPTSRVLSDLADRFNENHPSIEVDVELMPASAVYERLLAAINAGDPPDASAIHVNNVADIAAMGALHPLDQYFDAMPDKDDFVPTAVLGSRLGDESAPLHTMPWYGLVSYLYYRPDWFRDAGLPEPRTTDDFVSACRAVTDPAAGRYGYGLRGATHGHIHYFIWLATLGGLEAVQGPDGAPVFHQPEHIAGTDWFLDLARTHQVVPPTASGDGFEQLMNNMKAGVTGTAIHHIKSSETLVAALGAENIRAVPMPVGPSGRRWTEFGPSMNAVYAGGQDPEAAWEWVSYLASPEAMRIFCTEDGGLPVRQSVGADPYFQENPFAKVSIDSLPDAYLIPFTERPGYARLAEQTWPQLTQPALAGEMTSAEFAGRLAEDVR